MLEFRTVITTKIRLYKKLMLVKNILEKKNYGKILAKCSITALHEYLKLHFQYVCKTNSSIQQTAADNNYTT